MYGTHDRVTITRDGDPVAVPISPAELESIDATLEVLSDPAFNLAEFLAESAYADAHPEDRVTAEQFGAAYELCQRTGSWPDGWAT